MGKYDAELAANAAFIATHGKGILAADESTGTIGQRFNDISLENNEPNRRAYRDLLFNTKSGVHNFISGVILFDETFNQKSLEGDIRFPELLKSQNILTGIKVDKGTVVLPGTDSETATTGLDGLADRVKAYYAGGARFAKWRAVLKINEKTGAPSPLAIQENAHTLARYAAICQENGLVPIVEPEVLMDGEHSIEVSAAVTEKVLAAVFKALNDHHVLLEGIILKPNMVLSGVQAKHQADAETVAKYTVQTLQRTVPPAVPGINFLSGGQSEVDATLHLNAINKHPGKKPWTLSFSYGRALQASILQAWKGDAKNVEAARKVYLERAHYNSLAVKGEYTGEKAGEGATKSNFQGGYIY